MKEMNEFTNVENSKNGTVNQRSGIVKAFGKSSRGRVVTVEGVIFQLYNGVSFLCLFIFSN